MNFNIHHKAVHAIGNLALTIFFLTFFAQVWAAGPVPAASLPGGATVTDFDNGTGTSWGRPGGRDILYEDFVLANFLSLTYEPITIGIAMDGAIDSPSEVLSGPVFLNPTQVRWSGQTSMTLAGGGVATVYTRFTLTVPEGIDAGPLVDVFTVGGMFTTNLLFEASSAPGGPYSAAISFYDAAATPPGGPPPGPGGPVITSYDSGFFFEAPIGLSVAEHDANMYDQTNSILNILEFLEIEIPGRFIDMGLALDGMAEMIEWLKIDVGNLPDDTANAVRNALDEPLGDIQGLIACMWIGFQCPAFLPPGLPNIQGLAIAIDDLKELVEWVKIDLGELTINVDNQFTTVNSALGDLTTNVNTQFTDVNNALGGLAASIAAGREIELEVHYSERASNGSANLVVLTKLDGVPIDATIISVDAIGESNKNGFSSQALGFSASPVTTGLHELELSVPGNLSSVHTFLIQAEYADGSSTLHGSTLSVR